MKLYNTLVGSVTLTVLGSTAAVERKLDGHRSAGGEHPNRCPRWRTGDYVLPRASIEFTRFEDWDGPIGPYWETLPDYTEDWEAINCYLSIINAYIRPLNFRDPEIISDPELLEQILDDTADPQDIINELYIDSPQVFLRDVIYPAGRTPMFHIQDMHLNTTLVMLDGSVVAPFPLVFQYGAQDLTSLMYLNFEFAPLHMNFWQGLDENGHVDPNMDPVGVEDKFWFLPPHEPGGEPMYMMFYMGEGVVCKMRLWVGTDMGWELNYLGMWPHAAVTINNYNVFGQIVGAYDRWIAWYNLDDPSAQQTVDYYMARNEMQVSPDYDFVLGRNPWANLDIIARDTLDQIVIH